MDSEPLVKNERFRMYGRYWALKYCNIKIDKNALYDFFVKKSKCKKNHTPLTYIAYVNMDTVLIFDASEIIDWKNPNRFNYIDTSPEIRKISSWSLAVSILKGYDELYPKELPVVGVLDYKVCVRCTDSLELHNFSADHNECKKCEKSSKVSERKRLLLEEMKAVDTDGKLKRYTDAKDKLEFIKYNEREKAQNLEINELKLNMLKITNFVNKLYQIIPKEWTDKLDKEDIHSPPIVNENSGVYILIIGKASLVASKNFPYLRPDVFLSFEELKEYSVICIGLTKDKLTSYEKVRKQYEQFENFDIKVSLFSNLHEDMLENGKKDMNKVINYFKDDLTTIDSDCIGNTLEGFYTIKTEKIKYIRGMMATTFGNPF
jgi:hypothetical protein